MPAAAQTVLPLYDGPIPGALAAPDEESIRDPQEAFPFTQNVSRPTLTVYLPTEREAATPAVLILPGGSYRGVSLVKEGIDVARKFNELGIAAIVLKYRTPSPRHMADPSFGTNQDVLQALRFVRQRASEWQIDSRRIALLGFSAGGHAAAMAANGADNAHSTDAGVTSRVDLLILIYPVITLLDPYAHAASRRQLLGENPPVEKQRRFSMEFAVTAKTPPTFLVHAADDKSAPVQNSLEFFSALKTAGVPAELHIYEQGGHGFGLRNPTTVDSWFDRCAAWLSNRGWVSERK